MTSYSQHAIDLPLITIEVSAVFILVLAGSLPIQRFILGKVCLKAVVKIPLSLQRLDSARQVKISNHTMKVPRQLHPGGYSLQWPIRVGSARKGYLFQASSIKKSRDLGI